MKKSKKIICTILFTVILLGVFIATYFIKNEHFSLYELITPWICGAWLGNCVEKFYLWLDK